MVAMLFCVMLSERGRSEYMICGDGHEGLSKKKTLYFTFLIKCNVFSAVSGAEGGGLD